MAAVTKDDTFTKAQAGKNHMSGRVLATALFAEAMGTFIFQLFGGTEQQGDFNGLLLTVCIIMTSQASGGMLNPAVSLGVLVSGEMPAMRFLLYSAVQCLGAILAALVAWAIFIEQEPVTGAWSRPDLHWGNDNVGPGCRASLPGVAYGPAFVYELIGTFVLVSTVLASAVAKPGLGDLAPFAIGLAIFVAVGACGTITGGFFNPARFVGPAIVFGCNFRLIWLYWLAQFAGGTLAGLVHRFIFEPARTSTDSQLLTKGIELATLPGQ